MNISVQKAFGASKHKKAYQEGKTERDLFNENLLSSQTVLMSVLFVETYPRTNQDDKAVLHTQDWD